MLDGRYVMCSRCKRQSLLILTDDDGHEHLSCDCARPINPYINHCWGEFCSGQIDSRTCQKSKLPDMGYHCPLCGKDLSEYKVWKGEITKEQLQILVNQLWCKENPFSNGLEPRWDTGSESFMDVTVRG